MALWELSVFALLGTIVQAGVPVVPTKADDPSVDFQYYFANNTDRYVREGHATLRYWLKSPVGMGYADPIAFGPPNIMSVEVLLQGIFPANGGAFHLEADAYYVVIFGQGLIGGLDDGVPMHPGDWAWAMAGVSVGPIQSTGIDGNLVIYIISSGNLEMVSETETSVAVDEVVRFTNPTISESVNRTNLCRFSDSVMHCDYSGDHTADRVGWGPGGYENCQLTHSCIEPHFHPAGALYIGLGGRMFFGLDYADFDAWIDEGDVRWVRPGKWYGPEYTNDGCEFLAIHPSHGGSGDSKDRSSNWVSFSEPPLGSYVLEYTATVSKVFRKDDVRNRVKVKNELLVSRSLRTPNKVCVE